MNYVNRKILGFFVKTNGCFSRKIFSGIGHIIALHRVLPESPYIIPENKALEITPAFLEHLIHFYKEHNYEFASLDTLYNILTRKEKKKKKIVVLTFDDGYSDVYNYAFPILKMHSVPLNLYITTSFPEKTANIWWYALEELFRNKSEIALKFNSDSKKIKCKTIQEKQEAFKAIRNIVLNNYLNHKEILNDIFEQNGLSFNDINKKNTELNALCWSQIIEMSKNSLVCIGAHTVNHPILNKLTVEKVEEEVLNSKKIIEEKIQKEIHHFAYPHGGKDEIGKREFEILKNISFKTSTSTRQSNIFKGHNQYMACLPRISISNKTSEERLLFNINGISQFQRHGYKRIITL